MTRIAALSLALFISASLLAAAISGVDWLMSHALHWHVLARRGFPIAVSIAVSEVTCLVTCAWCVLAFDKSAARKKVEEAVRLTPLVRRDPVTGLREL